MTRDDEGEVPAYGPAPDLPPGIEAGAQHAPRPPVVDRQSPPVVDRQSPPRSHVGIVITAIGVVLVGITLGTTGYDVWERAVTDAEPTPTSEAPRPSSLPQPPPQPGSDLAEAMSLTPSLSESTSLSAYELWNAARGDSAVGAFGGEPVQTACFTMDGARWWVTVADAAACSVDHQLSWEGDDETVTAFGVGGVGAAIDVRPLVVSAQGEPAEPDLDSVSLAVANDAAAAGVTVEATTSVVIAGEEARRIDCGAPGYAHCVYYVLRAPSGEAEASGPQFFAARLLSGEDWVVEWSDVTSRFTDTFEWVPAE